MSDISDAPTILSDNSKFIMGGIVWRLSKKLRPLPESSGGRLLDFVTQTNSQISQPTSAARPKRNPERLRRYLAAWNASFVERPADVEATLNGGTMVTVHQEGPHWIVSAKLSMPGVMDATQRISFVDFPRSSFAEDSTVRSNTPTSEKSFVGSIVWGVNKVSIAWQFGASPNPPGSSNQGPDPSLGLQGVVDWLRRGELVRMNSIIDQRMENNLAWVDSLRADKHIAENALRNRLTTVTVHRDGTGWTVMALKGDNRSELEQAALQDLSVEEMSAKFSASMDWIPNRAQGSLD